MDTKYELVVCIVNAGFSENVMTAARAAGAKGGTIIRARGSANPASEVRHARLPCPSPTPGAWSNSCPSSR